jgi:hypothetical protein
MVVIIGDSHGEFNRAKPHRSLPGLRPGLIGFLNKISREARKVTENAEAMDIESTQLFQHISFIGRRYYNSNFWPVENFLVRDVKRKDSLLYT